MGHLGYSITENTEEQGIVQRLLQSVCRVWAVSYMGSLCIEVLCCECWGCKDMLFSDCFGFAPFRVKQLGSCSLWFCYGTVKGSTMLSRQLQLTYLGIGFLLAKKVDS